MKSTPKQHFGKINKYVRIPSNDVFLLADLQVPETAETLVILAYDFGRSRNHPRTRHVAAIMREIGLGTLLCDLLTDEEEIEDEATGKHRGDAALLARRLVAVTKWAATYPDTRKLRITYFGASTGGGAVLIAAARLRKKVKAVVSRGGRLDLAAKALPHVACPTLLVVGGEDAPGLQLCRDAMARLSCEKELVVVPGASSLFGEPGKLAEMAGLCARWLRSH